MKKKTNKETMKRLSMVVTVEQYEWLRREAFFRRQSMSSMFREMFMTYKEVIEFNKGIEEWKKQKGKSESSS